MWILEIDQGYHVGNIVELANNGPKMIVTKRLSTEKCECVYQFGNRLLKQEFDCCEIYFRGHLRVRVATESYPRLKGLTAEVDTSFSYTPLGEQKEKREEDDFNFSVEIKERVIDEKNDTCYRCVYWNEYERKFVELLLPIGIFVTTTKLLPMFK